MFPKLFEGRVFFYLLLRFVVATPVHQCVLLMTLYLLVRVAFQEMLKHHPNLQSQASEKEKRRATERSKLISDAYRKIKASFKK
mmetsp:Transcript_15134/g.33033  ORF Transcript_15134/g.33033 Transcript_15134/m.33033 type:complete len:84 (+) Transcript_15134:578-829(+)